MKSNIASLLFLAFTSILFSQNSRQQKTEQLDSLFTRSLSDNETQPVVNILCYVENEAAEFLYHRGFGRIAIDSEEQASKEHLFKTASITKTFTAVIILQMVEEGLIDLKKPAFHYLKDHNFIKFDSLHRFGGKSFGKQITIKQLLSHTSGLADIFEDARSKFDAHVMNNPQKQWSAEKLFELYYEFHVNDLAKFEPGTSYAYSDVGFFLLGLCIEKISGKSLAENYRKRIIEPLALSNTYFEYYEEKTTEIEQAHAYLGGLDIINNINTSFDWAGGGLVSNTEDLKTFIQALFDNQLFTNEATLNVMIEGEHYGYGIDIFNFEGNTYYGHLGFWGSGMFYNPKEEITIILSLNQTEIPFSFSDFILNIQRIIKQ